MTELWLRRIGMGVLALLVLPCYLLGYSVWSFAIGVGKGCEAWWADLKQYWKELKL